MTAYDVNVFVEIVSIFSENRRGNVTGEVNGGSVALNNNGGRQVVFVEIDDLSALIFDQKAFRLNFIDGFQHKIGIIRFAAVGIKFHIEHIVNAFKFIET